MQHEITRQGVNAVPPAAIYAIAYIAHITLDDWVKIATIGYIALQAVYLLIKVWRGK